MHELQYGQIVKSKAGRDKDRIFIVVDVQGEFALLADGQLRRVEDPKRKKMKHIQPTKKIIEELSDKLSRDKKVTNIEIRRHLAIYQVNDDTLKRGGG
ncbi:RNA-binding protein [Vallitalea pronyensis]|uniref:RNA-binding protein n=1 Tax=Vallitalea pronyensis TaxID=1348613 RepID=A0A8J8MH22_9FIRM|nr:KOW domain-containing RNA-binding protein [Vallitalea pronyensis]QUI21500.1 RNA-binding protein [Vallitalea pronyensis]